MKKCRRFERGQREQQEGSCNEALEKQTLQEGDSERSVAQGWSKQHMTHAYRTGVIP